MILTGPCYQKVTMRDGSVHLIDADHTNAPPGTIEFLRRTADGHFECVHSIPTQMVRRLETIPGRPEDSGGTMASPKAQKSPQAAPKGQELSLKEIAARLLGAMSDEPHGSKWLCREAGLEYSDLIVPILKKLHDVGKVKLEEGRWARA